MLFSFFFQYEYYYTYTCSKFGRHCKGLCILIILQTTFPLPPPPPPSMLHSREKKTTTTKQKTRKQNKTNTNRKNPDFSVHTAWPLGEIGFSVRIHNIQAVQIRFVI